MALLQDLEAEKEAKEARVAQLESTLASLTEENNSRIAELEDTLKLLNNDLAYLQGFLEEPWQITCSECGTILTISPPEAAVVGVITPIYCPVCGAKVWEAPTEGYTVSVGPAAEVPWYKRYAPHLAVGGAITTAITYFSLRKRG